MTKIEIVPVKGRVVVRWRGHALVDTKAALELREGVYPPVLYLPREDADMAFFAPSAHHTTCPHKGLASYFHLNDEAGRVDNAVWSYETPNAGVEAIAGRLAFYADRVEIVRA
ncbi:MAG: DUF427 domain-containing protein [Pseudomonadota bacterium]|nr:DUF427 domain-containing protein [Pseudomonadota bacterium]